MERLQVELLVRRVLQAKGHMLDKTPDIRHLLTNDENDFQECEEAILQSERTVDDVRTDLLGRGFQEDVALAALMTRSLNGTPPPQVSQGQKKPAPVTETVEICIKKARSKAGK